MINSNSDNSDYSSSYFINFFHETHLDISYTLVFCYFQTISLFIITVSYFYLKSKIDGYVYLIIEINKLFDFKSGRIQVRNKFVIT